MAELLGLTPLIFFTCLVLYVLGMERNGGAQAKGRRAIRMAALLGTDLCLMFWGLAFLQRADPTVGSGNSGATLGADWTGPLNDFFLTAAMDSVLGAQPAGFLCFGLSFVPFFMFFREFRSDE